MSVVYSKSSFDLTEVDLAVHTKIMKEKSSKRPVPRYSRNMTQAMKVQDRMAHSGFCCFELKADYNYTYKASFTEEGDHLHGKKTEIETQSPALSICVAALLASGVKPSKLPVELR